MALYNDYRPDQFSNVVGQDDTIGNILNQLRSGNTSHAYEFSGTRGTGKTSTAKLFGRAINCLNPSSGEPCNECEICKSTIAGRNVDFIEMDAASNNGVDDMRKIVDTVQYSPVSSKYKVYIIDEVHMLSKSAFNALLKTLFIRKRYRIITL